MLSKFSYKKKNKKKTKQKNNRIGMNKTTFFFSPETDTKNNFNVSSAYM